MSDCLNLRDGPERTFGNAVRLSECRATQVSLALKLAVTAQALDVAQCLL